MLEAFRRGGVDTDHLALLYPREVASALDDTRNLDPHDVDTLLTGCAQLSGDQSFGLHMVDFTELSMFGIYGYLLTHAPTVRRLLEIIELYYPTFYRGPGVTVTFDEPSCLFCYDFGGESQNRRRHTNEWTLGFFTDLIAKQVGHRHFLLKTEFTNSAPSDPTDLQHVFGDCISFNSKRTAFVFNSDILDQPLSGSSPHFMNILISHAEHLLRETQQPKPLAACVKLLIMELLESGEAHIDAISQRLAMSRTTLNRRLAADGRSFRQLRDDVILQVSCQALLDTDTEVGRIAHKLGFSELSSFDRCFRRIAGISPTGYRKNGTTQEQTTP